MRLNERCFAQEEMNIRLRNYRDLDFFCQYETYVENRIIDGKKKKKGERKKKKRRRDRTFYFFSIRIDDPDM